MVGQDSTGLPEKHTEFLYRVPLATICWALIVLCISKNSFNYHHNSMRWVLVTPIFFSGVLITIDKAKA